MAGRTPKPWYWSERRAWYVVIDGQRIRLGAHNDTAFRCFHRLMARRGTSPADPSPELTVGELIELYLADAEDRLRGNTYRVVSSYLKDFHKRLGRRRVRDLQTHHVTTWVRQYPTWNHNTRNHVLSRITALLRWGVSQGHVATNPVPVLPKPAKTSRGATALIAEDHHRTLLAAAPPYLRDVLLTLHQTGCRPCEVLSVSAADCDLDQGVWVLDDHKTAGVTGKPRVVYLTPDVMNLCRELAARHPTGPLFRRASGKPFPPAYYLARLVRQLRRRLGLPESITPYGNRHSWATRALTAGVPDALVAELLGHRGTAMLHKHYSHLGAKTRALREALNRVR
jgi:integrase